MRRTAALGVIVAALIWTLIWTAAGALAQPPDSDVPVGDGPTISLADLGSQSTLSFYVNRDVSSTSLTFPVPTGLTPAAITARIELPINLRFGNLAVTQGNRTISRQLLPAEDLAEVVVALNGVEVSGDWVNLTLTMTAVPLEAYCWDETAPIRLVDGAVSFAGGERPPTTVADFLPPVLRKVTIAVPAKPSQAETTAAVQVAAGVAKRNGQQPEVVVVPLRGGATTLPAPAGPFERQIVVKEGPQKGLSLQERPAQELPGPAALLISGSGPELAEQARLLTDDALRYAVSAGSVAQALPDPPLESDATTVGQLTGGGLGAEAMWPRVGIELDQTRWGHPLSGVSVRLIGSHTPLPNNFGGEVIVSIGSETIERWPTEAAGTIDRTVAVPDRLLKRFASLEVAVRTTGDTGRCGDYLPILLRIDGSTAITMQRAETPSPQGFQSLPQALGPRVQFGIGPNAFGDTVRAAQIMVGLQRSSAVPLLAEVTGFDQAMNSADPAVLISADGWKDKPLALPFSVDQGRVDVTGVDAQGQSVTLKLEPATGFGSLQTVFDGQRTVLVATSTGGPRQLDDLLRYLAAQPGRWSGLDGRAIISAPGVQPISVPVPKVDYSATPQSQPQTDSEERWFWWAAGGVAVVAALGALAILVRARRQ
jgi:hypothetical protein